MKISRRKPRVRRQYVRVTITGRVYGHGLSSYVDAAGKPVQPESWQVTAWVPLCRLPKVLEGVDR